MYKHHTNSSSDLDYLEFWLQTCKVVVTFQKYIPGPWKKSFHPQDLNVNIACQRNSPLLVYGGSERVKSLTTE